MRHASALLALLFCGQASFTFAAAPTFVQEAETAWNSTTTPKTTASFDVQEGDVLVAFGIIEGFHAASGSQTLNISGGSLSWTRQEEIAAVNYSYATIWTTTVDSNKSMTVSISMSGSGGLYFGGNVFTFRDSDGIGDTASSNGSGDPTVDITTTQVNSAVVVANGDWNAVDGSSRTWFTNAGTLTEQTYFRDSSYYTVYGGYHADAGSIDTYAVGIDAPGSQKYSIVTVEVTGSAGPPPCAAGQNIALLGVGCR